MDGSVADDAIEAGQYGLDNLVEAEPAFEMLFGCEPDLGVDDAVVGEVGGALLGDSGQRLGGLHHADGVLEGLQVSDQAAPGRSFDEPRRQLVGVRGGQLVVALFAGEIDHGLGADTAVEMIVQQDLGCGSNVLQGRCRIHGLNATRECPSQSLGIVGDMNDPKMVLTVEQIREVAPDDWRPSLTRLQTRFMTGDFATGLVLVNQIGAAAEEMDHHPDLVLTYPSLTVTLTSHDVGGITSRDIDLATQISKFAESAGVVADPDSVGGVD